MRPGWRMPAKSVANCVGIIVILEAPERPDGSSRISGGEPLRTMDQRLSPDPFGSSLFFFTYSPRHFPPLFPLQPFVLRWPRKPHSPRDTAGTTLCACFLKEFSRWILRARVPSIVSKVFSLPATPFPRGISGLSTGELYRRIFHACTLSIAVEIPWRFCPL